MNQRLLSVLLAATLLVPATFFFGPAAAEPIFDGDVVVNGAFTDVRTVGHPLKFYGEAMVDNSFVAYDWTAPDAVAGSIELVDGGLRMARMAGGDTPFVQQHFSGSGAPDRTMPFHGVRIVASAEEGANARLRIEMRMNDGNFPVTRDIPMGTTQTFDVLPSQFQSGLVTGDEQKMRSIRIWLEGSGPAVLHRVSVFADGGLDARDILIRPAGDDEVVRGDGAILQRPGADGAYQWRVALVDDRGHDVPAKSAVLCVYDWLQPPQNGFTSGGGTCPGAILTSAQSAAYRTADGDGFLFSVPASALTPTGAFTGGFLVWGSVQVDTPARTQWTPGYLSLVQIQLAEAGLGGVATGLADEEGRWFAPSQVPTGVFFDRNGDFIPDHLQTDDIDGYATIITPRAATPTPAATVMRPTGDAYAFDVQVYAYPALVDAAGAQGRGELLDLDASRLQFAIFGAQELLQAPGNGFEVDAIYRAQAQDVTQVDATTLRVSIPASEMSTTSAVGAWAYYAIAEPARHTVFEPVYGTSTSSFDFYSSLKAQAGPLMAADLMRNMGTPILLDAGGVTDDMTLLVRMDGTADSLTLMDGAVLVDAQGDGTVTFTYAMLDGAQSAYVPSQLFHRFALYDAAGAASAGFDPGSDHGKHALWYGQGTLQADGWFKVQVPVKAFEKAVGPVAAWASITEKATEPDTIRASYYNVVKPIVWDVAGGAPHAVTYPPTPLVMLDAKLGVPKALAATIAGLPGGLFTVTNPVVNPGFELNLLVEGGIDTRDDKSGVMTTPPWFFRLDDKGTGEQTTPVSTHKVVAGEGGLGSNALRIDYHHADRGKGLMLGQLLGNEGTSAFVWKDATAVSFDARNPGTARLTMQAVLRYVDADGDVKQAASTAHRIESSAMLERYTLQFSTPAVGELLGLYLLPSCTCRAVIYLDNVRIEGTTFVAGDARSDLSDGFAMIIEPRGLAGATQGVVQGATGSFFLYDVHAMDYRSGTPSAVSGLDITHRAFTLRSEEFRTDLGDFLVTRESVPRLVALVAAEDAPGPIASPWAFFDMQPAYESLWAGTMNQPASGYYNPMKNALKGTSLADQLDYAATPVRFDAGRVAATHDAQHHVRFSQAGSGYAVIVTSDSPFVESTTVTVSMPGATDQTFTVQLDDDSFGNVVPGLLIEAADLEKTTVTTQSTRFTTGVTVVAGSPTAGFEVCRLAYAGCLSTDIVSLETLRFHSTTVVPSGENVTLTWNFGDGSTPVTTTASHVDKSYNRPGTYPVNLTVTTASGKMDRLVLPIVVNNLDPFVNGIDVTPVPVTVDSVVVARARAGDADGGALTYHWTLEGMAIPSVTGSRLTLTSAILDLATGVGQLEKRTYALSVRVTDGQGGESAILQKSFTVDDQALIVHMPVVTPDADTNTSYALGGESVMVSGLVHDADNDVVTVTARFVPASGTTVEVPLSAIGLMNWEGTVDGLAVGVYLVSLRAVNDANEVVDGAAVPFEVRANAAPVVQVSGPETIDAFESAAFSAAGSFDPDHRGLLSYEWRVNGVLKGTNETFVFEPGADSGFHVLELKASDAHGGVTTRSMTLGVDDVILVDLRVDVAGPAGDTMATATVVDERGDPVAGAVVTFVDRMNLPGGGSQTHTATTDADGLATWTVPRLAGVLHLPGERTLTASVLADSRPDAVVQDLEEAEGSVTYDVTFLP